MQGQNEVEEILEQRLWAESVGVELGSAYLPVEALRAHELKTHRDCPLEYERTAKDDWAELAKFGLFLTTVLVVGVVLSLLLGELRRITGH